MWIKPYPIDRSGRVAPLIATVVHYITIIWSESDGARQVITFFQSQRSAQFVIGAKNGARCVVGTAFRRAMITHHPRVRLMSWYSVHALLS